MKNQDVLLIGEIVEVHGKTSKVLVYKNKNTKKIIYNGDLVRNVSVGSYIKIKKGYTDIIAVIEGEEIKENNDYQVDYSKFQDKYSRVLNVKVLGFLDSKRGFVPGLVENPMISNSVFVLDEDDVSKIFTFVKKGTPFISLGKITGYDSYDLKIEINKIFSSHIGIFGNTGSGKSNTLAKIYTELFSSSKKWESLKWEKGDFLFIDFNGEYLKDSVLNNKKAKYDLDTQVEKGKKYSLRKSVITDESFWSIILEATEKTQKPFLKRSIEKKYKDITENGKKYSVKDLVRLMHSKPQLFYDIKSYLHNLLKLIYKDDRKCNNIFNIHVFQSKNLFLQNNSYTRNFIEKNKDKNQFFELDYLIKFFKEFNLLDEVDLTDFNKLDVFLIALIDNFITETLYGSINFEFINPLMKRAENRISDIRKIFSFKNEKINNNIQIISLKNCNLYMKKIAPLLICKNQYDIQKKRNKETRSLHLVIDEAHNILSGQSSRESESWKDYRLEVFEEIIKEGRKFGCFLTIASQRPSDISPTIISQLHNTFIHRLVNEEDLRMIRKNISFLDKSNEEMIPILSQGQCICSGTSFIFPVNVQVDELDSDLKPESNDWTLFDINKNDTLY